MNNIAILVNSCDAYSDIWPYFFRLLAVNWNNINDYNIYLNTESINVFDFGLPVTIINTKQQSGEDKWGKRLVNSLSQIKEEYVVMLMDDFFLRSQLNDQILLNCIKYFENDSKIAVYYLINIFKHVLPKSSYEKFGEIPKNTNYRLNSAPALWRRSKLQKYIKDTDNPWAWEYFGTCRTNHSDDLFYCVEESTPIYDYAHAIYRGKWLEKDINPLISKFDLDIDTTKRGAIKEGELLPKRSIKWKINFILTGIKMVGIDAIKVVIRDVNNR